MLGIDPCILVQGSDIIDTHPWRAARVWRRSCSKRCPLRRSCQRCRWAPLHTLRPEGRNAFWRPRSKPPYTYSTIVCSGTIDVRQSRFSHVFIHSRMNGRSDPVYTTPAYILSALVVGLNPILIRYDQMISELMITFK